MTSFENIKSFDLDHQGLVFYPNIITFSWRGNSESACDQVYQLNSTSCNNTEVYPPIREINGTTVNVSASDLTYRSNAPVFFKLFATNSSGDVCQEVQPYIVINTSGMKTVIKVVCIII